MATFKNIPVYQQVPVIDMLQYGVLEDFEEYNREYDDDKYRLSETTRYNITAIKRWLSIRDDLTFVNEFDVHDHWQALDIKESHSKYGTNYIYVEMTKGLWRIKTTGDEFYNQPGRPLL